MINYLEHVANLIDQDYPKGEDWEISGDSEIEKAEEEAAVDCETKILQGTLF